MRLILASASPRRAALLTSMGLDFEQRSTAVDESARPGEAAGAYVLRLARDKALAGYQTAPGCLVLGADTAVVLDDRILGKPADRAAAADMLQALAGREHQVLTGVAVAGPAGCVSDCVTTRVRFRAIEDWEIDAYCRTGEGDDKAGGYGIQGIGGIFAASIRGSYSAVVGLPLAETERLLRDSGLDTWQQRLPGRHGRLQST